MADIRKEVDVDKGAEEFSGGFTLIEPGWKTFVYLKDEIKPTSSGKGDKLVIDLQLKDGREMKYSLNILNESQVAMKIAEKQLSKIAHCIGHRGKLNRTEPLFGRRFDALVAIKKFKSNKANDDGTFPMLESNDLTDFKPAGEGASVVPEASSNKEESVGW